MASTFEITRICGHCENEFIAKKTTTKYCSLKCASKAYKQRQRAGKIEASDKETRVIKAKPIQVLKEYEFLSLSEVATLIRVSKRTIYRLIERGELPAYKVGNRTIIKRIDIDRLFDMAMMDLTPIQREVPKEKHQFNQHPEKFDESLYLTTKEVQQLYTVSDNGLRAMLKRKGITTIKKGWYAYVLRVDIEQIFA